MSEQPFNEAVADDAETEASEEQEPSPEQEASPADEVTDLDTADEVEAPEAEPPVESPVEIPEAATAEVLEIPDRGGLPEPDEETVAEAPPEVAEAIEEPIAETAEEVEATPEVEVVEEPAEDVAAAASADEAAVAAVGEAEAEPEGRDPFKGPGDWYVVHTYAGYENKVKANLESRIGSMQMQDKIFDVEIPMEDVMEIKGGKKQVVQKKVFPGYLLVKMVYDNDSWYVVRNTPGVTGFVSSGTGTKPTPLSKREVEKILSVKKEEVKPTFRLEFEEGDVVRIISGPFADFNGTVDEINVDQSKLKVLVNIFDRETPVELGFDQVAKV
ncbi:MAG: transcription termination/antitermination protein NusG [Actinomycetota bacterium]